MKTILNKLVEDFKFEKLQEDISNINERDIDIYVNKFSGELYIFDYSNNLDVKHILQILNEIVYKNRNIKKENKANMVFISVFECEVFDENTRNTIMQVEENNLYCQKFVLYYTKEEEQFLESMLNENSLKRYLDDMVMASEVFHDYKIVSKEKKVSDIAIKNNAKKYSIVSKIFIKLPFMTLLNVGKFNKSINDYIIKNLNEISENLYSELNIAENEKDNEFIDKVLMLVNLGTSDEKEINKELEKVGAYIEE